MVRNLGIAEFHLKEGKDFEVKEIFKEFSGRIKDHFGDGTENLSILDVGCASGELLSFLKADTGTTGDLAGIDLSDELIENARERFADPDIEFSVADAATFKSSKKYDLITMASVLSYFDDPYPVLKNMLSHLNPGGLVLVSGVFNDYGIEVRMSYKLPTHDKWMKHAVLHQFSLESMLKFFDDNGYSCTESKQIMPFELKPKENPGRSWTVDLDGERHMMSGLQLIYNISILQITPKAAQ